MDYQKLYTGLFNDVTRAVAAIDAMNYGMARQLLVQAQLSAEEAYIEDGDSETAEAE